MYERAVNETVIPSTHAQTPTPLTVKSTEPCEKYYPSAAAIQCCELFMKCPPLTVSERIDGPAVGDYYFISAPAKRSASIFSMLE